MKSHEEMISALGVATTLTLFDVAIERFLNGCKKKFDHIMLSIPMKIPNAVILRIKKETTGGEVMRTLRDLLSVTPTDNDFVDRIDCSDAGKIKRMVIKDHAKSNTTKILNLIQSAYRGDPLEQGKELSNYFLFCGFHLLTIPSRTAGNQMHRIMSRDATAKAIATLTLISILVKNQPTKDELRQLKMHLHELFLKGNKLSDLARYLESQSVRDQLSLLHLIDEIASAPVVIHDNQLQDDLLKIGRTCLAQLIFKPFMNLYRWDNEPLDDIATLSDKIAGVLFLEFSAITQFIHRSKFIIKDADDRTKTLRHFVEKLLNNNDRMLIRTRRLSIDTLLTKAGIEATLHLYRKNQKIITPAQLHHVIRQMDDLESFTAPRGKYNSEIVKRLNTLQTNHSTVTSGPVGLFLLLVFAYCFERTLHHLSSNDTAWEDRSPTEITAAILMIALMQTILSGMGILTFAAETKIIPLHFNRPDWVDDFEKKYKDRLEREAAQKLRAEQPQTSSQPADDSVSHFYEEETILRKPAVELQKVNFSVEFNKIKTKIESEYKQTKGLFMKKMGSKHVIYETLCTRFENDPLAFYDDQGKFDQSKLYALMEHELTKMLSETKKSEPIHFEISKIIDFYAEEQRVTPPTPPMQQLPLDLDVNVQVPVTQKVNNQRSKSPTETQAPKPQYIQFAYGDTTREIFYQDLQAVLDLGRKLEAIGAGNDEESLLELKHNIIEFCVRLHAIKKSVPAFYHAMISTFPNALDPISVIRHGAVHHDLLISTEEKFPFYRAIAQQLVQITRLHTPGAELKANDLVIKALEKSDTFPLSFRHCGEMYTRFESEALVWRDEPVQNKLAPEHLEDRIRSRMEFISSDASKIAITMAIVELGEIFSQLRNHGSLDQISVHKKTVGKCIEIRNKAVHGAELGDAVDKLLSQVLNGKSPRSEG